MIVSGIDKKIETRLIEIFDISSIEQGILDRFLPAKTPDITNEKKDINPTSEISLNVVNPTQASEIPTSLTNWINSNPLTMASLK